MDVCVPRRLGAAEVQTLPCNALDGADLVELSESKPGLRRGGLWPVGKQRREGEVVEKRVLLFPCILRQPHLVETRGVFLGFPVNRVGGRKILE